MNDDVIPTSTTYYNSQGMSSTTPFDGFNIVVTQYKNGKTMVQKHIH